MSDLVERLRKPIGACLVDGTHFKKGDPIHDTLRVEAAAEITALRARVAELEASPDEWREHYERAVGEITRVRAEVKRLTAQIDQETKLHLESEAASDALVVGLKDRVERLRAFVRDLFEATSWPEGGDLDLFAFEELCEEHGLLTPEKRHEPCGDECFCAEHHGDMSDGVTCYRKADWITAPALAQTEEATNEWSS